MKSSTSDGSSFALSMNLCGMLPIVPNFNNATQEEKTYKTYKVYRPLAFCAVGVDSNFLFLIGTRRRLRRAEMRPQRSININVGKSWRPPSTSLELKSEHDCEGENLPGRGSASSASWISRLALRGSWLTEGNVDVYAFVYACVFCACSAHRPTVHLFVPEPARTVESGSGTQDNA
jgi:hypothetical protein